MTRTISKSLSCILETFELESVDFVTLDMIDRIAKSYNIGSNAYVIAQRLKKSGWLLPTSCSGVWEFASAAMAGPYSKNDPLMEVKVFNLANPSLNSYLCLQTAAWALGCSDRLPLKKEIAFEYNPYKIINCNLKTYTYSSTLPLKNIRGVNCLSPEGIIVHIASKPAIINSWISAMEWIPEIVYEVDINKLLLELTSKNNSVKRRTGYLLQGMFPSASSVIYDSVEIKSKIRFGPRTSALRNDEKWMISDTVLPFSPLETGKVK